MRVLRDPSGVGDRHGPRSGSVVAFDVMIMATVERAIRRPGQRDAAHGAWPRLVSARLPLHGGDICRTARNRGSIRGRKPLDL